jgi:hypothetical protein
MILIVDTALISTYLVKDNLTATETGCNLQSSDTYWTSHSTTQHIYNVYFIIYYIVSRSLKRICSHSQMLNVKKLEIRNKELLLGFVFLCLFLCTYLSIFCYWKFERVTILITEFISVISSFSKIIWVLVLHMQSAKLPLLCLYMYPDIMQILVFILHLLLFCFLWCRHINWE